jgi:uncharacterized protein (TIGR02217 family)
MSFHDIEFPREISYNSKSVVAFNTQIVELPSGAEQRNALWSRPRISFDIRLAERDYDQLAELIEFHRAREGRTHTFRYWDPLDYSTNPLQRPHNDDTVDATNADVQIGTGGGGATQFQLTKEYTSGTTTKVRNITLPIDGTVTIAVNGVAKTEGLDYEVDYSTGIVTFTSAPTNGYDITAGCKFNVHTRFELDQLVLDLVGFDRGDVPQCGAIEVFDSLATNDAFLYGGSSLQAITANAVLSPLWGRFVRLNVTVASLSLFMPSITPYKYGGVHWILENVGTQSVTIKDGTTTLTTLAVNDVVQVLVGKNSSNDGPEWVLI